MKKLIITIIGTIQLLNINATDIKIALFYGSETRSAVFSVVEGEYVMMGDGQKIAVVTKGSVFYCEREGNGIAVNDASHTFGIYSSIEFRGISAGNIFQIKPVLPAQQAKESDDHLIIKTNGRYIQFINEIDIEKYIPGTVESEGGSNAFPEYYKAQAVISRTFAVKNMLRHAHEGFNLCDGVHCQAYNGKSRMNDNIYDAALSTKGEILTGIDNEPIIAAFHACCGGNTSDAATEWSSPLYYLTPVKDPFCSESSSFNWEKTITLNEWRNYLQKKGFRDDMSVLFSQTNSGRRKFLDPDTKKLPLTSIREDFNLKSSYFIILSPASNESILIKGHGYGHGLGLCQEGAMQMAKVGYTYVDILMFYYTRVSIGKMNNEEVTRDEYPLNPPEGGHFKPYQTTQ